MRCEACGDQSCGCDVGGKCSCGKDCKCVKKAGQRREVGFTLSSRHGHERPSEPRGESGQGGPRSAGQSGDTQGLSDIPDATGRSVESLVESGQVYEAGVVEGVEDGADHPARSVHTREDEARPRSRAPVVSE